MSDRSAAAWWHVAAAVGLAAAGVVAVVWRPTAAPVGAVRTTLDRFAPEVLDVVWAYRVPRRWIGLATFAVATAVPVAAVATAGGRRAVGRLAGHGGRWRPARGALVAVTVAIAVDVVTLPSGFWLGFVQDGRFGFRTAGLAGWWRDWAIQAGTRWSIAAALGAGLVWLVDRRPRDWHWIGVWAGTAGAALVVFLGPVVLEPLLLPTRPLGPGQTRDAVREVLERAGLGDVPVLVGDASRRTTKANAYVSGLGPSRRVVVFDNLLELAPDRVALVVAHEVAHREHRDIPRSVLLTASGLLAGVLILRWWQRSGRWGAHGPELVAVALALVAAATALTAPATAMLSRRAEAAADQRALELTRDPGTAAAVARLFVVRDLADPRPPGWHQVLFGTHPTPSERIRAAVAYARHHGLELPALEQLRASEAALLHPRLDDG